MIGWIAAATTLVLVPAWLCAPHVHQVIGNAVRRVATREKVIALTFDDGPEPEWTPVLLDVLAREQIKATFFVVGSRVQQNPALAQKIWGTGHEIGNHSWSHHFMFLKSEKILQEEIEKTDMLLHELGYAKEIYFRAPCGLKFFALPRMLTALHKKHILFDVIAWDWKSPGVNAIVRRVMKAARPGSIILLHDGCGFQKDTVLAVATIIAQLKAQGYRFVTISELLTYGSPAR